MKHRLEASKFRKTRNRLTNLPLSLRRKWNIALTLTT